MFQMRKTDINPAVTVCKIFSFTRNLQETLKYMALVYDDVRAKAQHSVNKR